MREVLKDIFQGSILIDPARTGEVYLWLLWPLGCWTDNRAMRGRLETLSEQKRKTTLRLGPSSLFEEREIFEIIDG